MRGLGPAAGGAAVVEPSAYPGGRRAARLRRTGQAVMTSTCSGAVASAARRRSKVATRAP